MQAVVRRVDPFLNQRGRGYVPPGEPDEDGSYDWASGSGARVFESFEEAGRFVDTQKGDGKWCIERA